MSCHLSRELRTQFKVRALPIRKDDEIEVKRGKAPKQSKHIIGNNKGKKGKILKVYRKRWCVHVDKITKDSAKGTQVQIPLHPSKLQITSLKMDKDRKKLIEKKKVQEKGKGKYKAGEAAMGLD